MKIKAKGLKFAVLAVLVMFAMSVFTLFTPVAKADGGVASIAGTYYDTIQEAIIAAENSTDPDYNKVVLEADVVISEPLIINGTVVLSLNGKKITTDKTNWTGDNMITVKRGAALTVIDSANGEIYGGDNEKVVTAIKLTEAGETVNGTIAQLTVEGGKVTGYYYGIAGNGNRHDTVVTVSKKAVICGVNAAGIFNPQNGKVNVYDDALIIGKTGIEMRAGTLTISGGKVAATSNKFEATANGSGATIEGAAIAISQHTTNLPINVIIDKGTFMGVRALHEEDLQDAMSNNVSIIIHGGIFDGLVYSENLTEFVDGGSYTLLDNSYVRPGSDITINVAKIMTTDEYSYDYYTTLEAAIAAVEDGEEIVIINNIEAAQTIEITEGDFAIAMLGGMTISTTAADPLFMITGGDITVYKNDYNVEEYAFINAQKDAFYIDASATGAQAALTLGEGLKVYSSDSNVVYMRGNATFNLEGAELLSDSVNYAAVQGNGTYGGTTININSGSIVSTNSTAIYNPQDGIINVAGGKIEGEAGIVIRNGELNITDGKIEAKATTFVPETGNLSGTDVEGAAIAVVDHNTDGSVTVNISGGEMIGQVAFYEQAAYGVDNVIDITGGKFDGVQNAILAENAVNFVTDGWFRGESTRTATIREKAFGKPDVDGWYTVVTAEVRMNNIGFAALEEAVAEAIVDETTNGAAKSEIYLLLDVALEDILEVSSQGEIVILMEGKTITSTADKAFNTINGTFEITNGTVNAANHAIYADAAVSAIVDITNVEINAEAGVAVIAKNNTNVAIENSAIYSNSTNYAAIQGNGNCTNTTININDSTVESTKNIAIYAPQSGIMNIAGESVIKGVSGIVIRNGFLSISGETQVIATATEFIGETGNASGTDVEGAAVAVVDHTTTGAPTLYIDSEDVVLEGLVAIYEQAAYGEKNTLTIAAGTYKGTLATIVAENAVNFVSGGKFYGEVQYETAAAGKAYVPSYDANGDLEYHTIGNANVITLREIAGLDVTIGYYDLDTAILDSENEDEIYLQADAEINNSFNIEDKEIVIYGYAYGDAPALTYDVSINVSYNKIADTALLAIVYANVIIATEEDDFTAPVSVIEISGDLYILYSTLSGEDYYSGYAVFGLCNDAELQIHNTQVSFNNDLSTVDGGLFKNMDGTLDTTVIFMDSNLELVDVVRVSVSGVIGFINSNLEAYGVNDNFNNGFNESSVLFIDSTAKVYGGQGRAFTFNTLGTETNQLMLQNSVVEFSDMEEGAIRFKNDDPAVLVDATSKLIFDNAYVDAPETFAPMFIIDAGGYMTSLNVAVNNWLYEDIDLAFAKANDETTDVVYVTLYADLTPDAKIEIKKNIELNLNGQWLTINAVADNYNIVIYDTLTITDKSVSATNPYYGGIEFYVDYGIGLATTCTGGLIVENGYLYSEGDYLIGAFAGKVTINGGWLETEDYCIVNAFVDDAKGYNATVEINGGIFYTYATNVDDTKYILLGNVEASVKGGYFNVNIDRKYITPGYAIMPYGDLDVFADTTVVLNDMYYVTDLQEYIDELYEDLEEKADEILENNGPYSEEGEAAFEYILDKALDEFAELVDSTPGTMDDADDVYDENLQLLLMILSANEYRLLKLEMMVTIEHHLSQYGLTIDDVTLPEFAVPVDYLMYEELLAWMVDIDNTYGSDVDTVRLAEVKAAAIAELYGDNNVNEKDVTSAMVAAIYSATTEAEVTFALNVAKAEMVEIKNYKTFIRNVRDSIDPFKTTLDELKTLIGAVGGTEFTAILDKIDDTLEAIDGVQTTADEINGKTLTAAEIQAKLDALKTNVFDKLDTDLGDLEDVVTTDIANLKTALEGKLDTVYADIVKAIDDMATATANGFTALNDKLTQMATDISGEIEGIKTEIATNLTNEINAVKTAIANAQTTIDGIKASVNDIKAGALDANDLANAIKAINDELADQSNEIATAFSAVIADLAEISASNSAMRNENLAMLAELKVLINRIPGQVDFSGVLAQIERVERLLGNVGSDMDINNEKVANTNDTMMTLIVIIVVVQVLVLALVAAAFIMVLKRRMR